MNKKLPHPDLSLFPERVEEVLRLKKKKVREALSRKELARLKELTTISRAYLDGMLQSGMSKKGAQHLHHFKSCSVYGGPTIIPLAAAFLDLVYANRINQYEYYRKIIDPKNDLRRYRGKYPVKGS